MIISVSVSLVITCIWYFSSKYQLSKRPGQLYSREFEISHPKEISEKKHNSTLRAALDEKDKVNIIFEEQAQTLSRNPSSVSNNAVRNNVASNDKTFRIKGSQLDSDEKISQFLKEQLLVNAKEAYMKANSFTDISPELENLRATYTGDLVFSSTGLTWQLKIRFNPTLSQNLVKANLEVDIFENAVIIPTLRYQSGIRELPGMDVISNSILIEVIRNNYLQLFYFEKLDIWAGNYYLSDSKGVFKRIATISLIRH